MTEFTEPSKESQDRDGHTAPVTGRCRQARRPPGGRLFFQVAGAVQVVLTSPGVRDGNVAICRVATAVANIVMAECDSAFFRSSHPRHGGLRSERSPQTGRAVE